VLLVIFFATGVPTTTPSNFHHDVSTQLFCKPPERQYICQRGKKLMYCTTVVGTR
jgi:hypothetical protein